MRKKLMLTAVLCLSAAWLMAQEPTSPGAASGSSGQNATQSVPATRPSSPGAQSGAASSAPQTGGMAGQGADVSIVQGCLGGSNPNYTVTDKGGKTYKLVTPPQADVSVLSKHIGEPVAVMGAVDGASASSDNSSGSIANKPDGSAASSSQGSIQVMRIGRGTGSCPASPGGATPKAPADKK